MKGMFIQCPYKECKKPLMKNVYLRPGSFLTTKCYWCGSTITICSEVGNIKLIIEKTENNYDEEENILNLTL